MNHFKQVVHNDCPAVVWSHAFTCLLYYILNALVILFPSTRWCKQDIHETLHHSIGWSANVFKNKFWNRLMTHVIPSLHVRPYTDCAYSRPKYEDRLLAHVRPNQTIYYQAFLQARVLRTNFWAVTRLDSLEFLIFGTTSVPARSRADPPPPKQLCRGHSWNKFHCRAIMQLCAFSVCLYALWWTAYIFHYVSEIYHFN